MKKYFITGDLEKTLTGGCDIIQNSTISIDPKVRDNISKIINKSFNSEVTEFISYDSVVNYFEELRKKEEFIIGLDNGIYIENPDFDYSSTRTYKNKNSILNSPNDYLILQRDGSKLTNQNNKLKESIFKSGKKEIIICDDGLFSGDTLDNIITNDIKKYIKEIRVILNFSGKNELNGIPIKAMINKDKCIDWLDERDLFYGTQNGGASFMYKGSMNGLPYISNQQIANKKASIPIKSSKNFVKSMLDLNKDVWTNLGSNQNTDIKLNNLPRISYLEEEYDKKLSIQEIIKTININ